jgi:hypothetical protein
MQEQQLISDEKPTAFDNQLVYEAKSAMRLSNNQCGACERIGFPIFLVRKSVVPKYFKKNIDWSKGMLPLGQHR